MDFTNEFFQKQTICFSRLEIPKTETGSSVGVGGVCLVFGFFAFVTPLLLHLITKRYVVYVDYNPLTDSYIATTYSIFVQKKEIEFKPEDVKLPEISEMLTSCFVKGIPMFMDVQNFTNIDHYKRIMGFDKPMDFSFPTEDMNSKGK
ncbi:transmembrane protein 70 homolog, mitochondrial isoform X3 [Venturia canescens]|uniref:transmembrane protein 70 homolog, mitochondrial isoform X3 n=1 Tax=Venturia canescens TaxID=32260 RepID=UPI001C9C979D|nr:transmembrane protein 70 homolog, mitochondrial isoform X3 [Venturia canescens]